MTTMLVLTENVFLGNEGFVCVSNQRIVCFLQQQFQWKRKNHTMRRNYVKSPLIEIDFFGPCVCTVLEVQKNGLDHRIEKYGLTHALGRHHIWYINKQCTTIIHCSFRSNAHFITSSVNKRIIFDQC